MKKIYTLCLLSFAGLTSFAQNRATVQTNQQLNWSTRPTSPNTIVATPTDTLWGNVANWTGAQCNGSVGGGYVMGNNGYGDKQKVQAFFSSGPTIVIGCIYWFGAKDVANGGPTSVVKMRIYAMDGPNGTTSAGTAQSPNTVIKNDDVMITAVDTSSMLGGAYVHTFSTQTYLGTQDFGVGFAMTSLLAGDTIGGVYSADGDATNIDQSWDQYSDNSWHTWADPNNWNMNCDMAIFPIVSMNTGIEESFINGVNLSTYPNPAVDQATITYNLQNDANNVEIKILDATGKVVSVISEGKQQCGAHTLTVDASTFAKGTYFVTLKAGNGRIATKLVIQ